MRRRLALLFLVGMVTVVPARITSWKGAVHLSAVPFILGSGIYSSTRILQTSDATGVRAGAITNLALLGVQASLGATILFGPDDLPPAVRLIHRIVGSCVIASAIWTSIGSTVDDDVPHAARYTAYAHAVLASAPLILLSF
jgi:heme A synthase